MGINSKSTLPPDPAEGLLSPRSRMGGEDIFLPAVAVGAVAIIAAVALLTDGSNSRVVTSETPASSAADLSSTTVTAQESSTTTEPEKPKLQLFTEVDGKPLFSLQTPFGWQKGKSERKLYGNTMIYSFMYEDPNTGDYFVVDVDYPGSEFVADESWSYVVDSNDSTVSLTPKKYVASCRPNTACTVGDGKLQIGIRHDDQDPKEKVNGRHYFFTAGNSQQETEGNILVFQNIIESFQAFPYP